MCKSCTNLNRLLLFRIVCIITLILGVANLHHYKAVNLWGAAVKFIILSEGRREGGRECVCE